MQVWDANDDRDDLIGQVYVNFSRDLVKGERSERWSAARVFLCSSCSQVHFRFSLTPDDCRAFHAVQRKADSSHAGQVLLSLRLQDGQYMGDQGSEMEQTVTREEEETVIRRPWGPEVVVDNSDLSFKAQTSQTISQKMRSRSAAVLVVCCKLTSICSLEVVRNGINPSVKKDLHAMIEGLIKSVSAQILNQLYAADSLLSDVKRLANKVLSMLQGDDEDIQDRSLQYR